MYNLGIVSSRRNYFIADDGFLRWSMLNRLTVSYEMSPIGALAWYSPYTPVVAVHTDCSIKQTLQGLHQMARPSVAMSFPLASS